MKRIILTTADAAYVDVLRTFLFSLRYHGNNEHVRCDCLGYSDAQKKSVLACGENIEIVDLPAVQDDDKKLLHLMWTRPIQMTKALEEGWEQICSMDCDIIIRGKLDGIWDDVAPGVLKIMDKSRYRKTSNKTKFQGGVYFFGNSPEIREFYAEIVSKIGPCFGFYDGQRALLDVYRQYINKIKLLHLDVIYNDERNTGWAEKSKVWHAKHGRIRNMPFAAEASKYLKMCNERYLNG